MKKFYNFVFKPFKMFQTKLFPNYFKKIALIILSIDFLFLFLSKLDFLVLDNQFSKTLFSMILILSGFIWIFSKLKIENEQANQIRVQAFIISFVFIVMTFFVEPIIGLVFEGNISGFKFESSAFSMVMKMLMFYILFFNLLLRKLKK